MLFCIIKNYIVTPKTFVIIKNISGMVMIESTVDSNTTIDANSPSALNLIANIAVDVALGIDIVKNTAYLTIVDTGKKETTSIDINDITISFKKHE